MSENKQKTIIIVGAGPGGLVAGMLLSHYGFKVKIFEKESVPGGRNGYLQLGNYKFDIGPTFFMMDYVLRDIFSSTGRNLEDYVEMTKLSPMYRLFFEDKYLDIYDEKEKMRDELKRVFPGEENGIDKFMAKEKQRLNKLFPLLSNHNNNIFEVFSWRFFRALPAFAIGRSLFSVMGNYFKSEYAKLSFTFQSKYLGMSPWECPGAFAMVPYVEHASGIYHSRGGISETALAMARVIKENKGEIFYNKKVKQLILENKKVVGVELQDGQKEFADEVVVNADFSYAMKNLIPPGILKKWSPEKLKKKRYSCSIFMLYLGINKTLPLLHHNIAFAQNYRQNILDVFSGKLTGKDFSFYVRDATKTDPTLAPSGKSALYILVPVANNRTGINWTEKKQEIRNRVLELMNIRLGVGDLSKNIEVEKIITPDDWEKDFNVDLGAVFNLAHNLGQMLWLRPHNRFEELQNLYLVGGGTHPGSGLPTIYQSGKIAADLIKEKYL